MKSPMLSMDEALAALLAQAQPLVDVERVDTLAALLGCDHGLSAWYPACRRWADLDLGRLVAEGHGSRRLVTLKPRCGGCGKLGQIQVRPPRPGRR